MDKSIKTKDTFEKELQMRFPENDIEILKYTKASGPIEYRCKKCGQVYQKSRANHLYGNKTLCSKCYSGKASALREAFLQRNGIDYKILEDNLLKPISEKFSIQCLKCGRVYDYKIQQNIQNSFSCRYCGKNGSPVIKEEFLSRLNNISSDFSVIKYKNFTSSATFKHSCGYVFSRLPANMLRNPTCPHCSPKRSAGEQKIYQWLNNHGISFEEQKHFEELGRLSYDFYLPIENMVIEYQGEQHIKPVNYFGGEDKFQKQIENDTKKKIFAEQHGLSLLEIFYYDFNKIEEILEGSTTKVDSSESKKGATLRG